MQAVLPRPRILPGPRRPPLPVVSRPTTDSSLLAQKGVWKKKIMTFKPVLCRMILTGLWDCPRGDWPLQSQPDCNAAVANCLKSLVRSSAQLLAGQYTTRSLPLGLVDSLSSSMPSPSHLGPGSL